jgi:ketosteroid isomerase-like protein
VLKQHYQAKDLDGNDVHWVMRQTDGVVRQDGRWKIAHTHYSWPVTPPPDYRADLTCSPRPHPWQA